MMDQDSNDNVNRASVKQKLNEIIQALVAANRLEDAARVYESIDLVIRNYDAFESLIKGPTNISFFLLMLNSKLKAEAEVKQQRAENEKLRVQRILEQGFSGPEKERVTSALMKLAAMPCTSETTSQLICILTFDMALNYLAPVQNILCTTAHTCSEIPSTIRSNEGVAPSDLILSLRSATCVEIYEKAFSKGALLVKGPPFCGKTSLAKSLIPKELGQKKPVYVASALNRSIPKFWENIYAFINARRGLLIVDEAQALYTDPAANELWGNVKSLSGDKPSNFAILCFGVYGGVVLPSGATPVDFNDSNTLYLDTLRFRESEAQEIITRVNNYGKEQGINFKISDFIAKELYNYTGGHPGLYSAVLEDMLKRHRTSSSIVNEEKLFWYIHSDEVQFIARSSRCFTSYNTPDCDISEKNILKAIILTPGMKIPRNAFTGDYEHALVRLLKRGVITSDTGGCHFASPLLSGCYLAELFQPKTTATEAVKMPENIVNLVLSALARISWTNVCASVGVGAGGRLSEESWRVLLCSALQEILPPRLISVDVGPQWGSTGALDIYINEPLKWGLELVLEKRDIQEHISRFDTSNGRYKQIPLKNWLVVEFRHTLPRNNWTHDQTDHIIQIVIRDPKIGPCDVYQGGLSLPGVRLAD